MEELRNSEIRKNREFQNCLNLAEQLDNLNERLQVQIENCGRNLQHFEFVSNLSNYEQILIYFIFQPATPLFITNININHYNVYFNNMISFLKASVKNESISSCLNGTALRHSYIDMQEEEVHMFKER